MTKPFDYISSDWHFKHKNILKYNPMFRQYEDSDTMTSEIVRLLNEQVAPRSQVLFLGDGALNPKTLFQVIPLLHFDILWAPGNHDFFWKFGSFGKRERFMSEVTNVKEIANEFTFTIAGKQVMCGHLPWAGQKNDERHDERYADIKPRQEDFPDIEYRLHGHCHSTPEFKFSQKAVDVGWDAWGRAVTYEEIEEIVNARA